MRIITEPSIYLIASQIVDQDEVKRFEQDEGVHYQQTTHISSQNLVEMAGRVCYMSFAKPRPGGNHAYIQHILEVGHGSVLEHAVFSLLITGVSRSLTHELIRHRVGMSPSQLSQRYVDESDCGMVIPPIYREAIEFFDAVEKQKSLIEFQRMFDLNGVQADCLYDIGRLWKEAMNQAQGFYGRLASLTDKLLELNGIDDKTARRKQAREAARSVLPNATETKIFMTGNARAWRHFLEMRGSEHADAEINRLARAVLAKLQSAAPNLFGDYVVKNGVIDTPFRKV